MTARPLFSYRPYWAHRFGIAPYLPTTRAEMDELGWDSCDVILVTGDAYIDHPSFGMALVGRLLESHGFRVGILDQPAWGGPTRGGPDAFQELGRPSLFIGQTAEIRAFRTLFSRLHAGAIGGADLSAIIRPILDDLPT